MSRRLLRLRGALSGAAAGLINGFFGGSGGLVLVPLFVRWCSLDRRRGFASSVAVILPLCVLSSAIYFFRGGLDLFAALPFLLGGPAGGFLGGKIYKRVSMLWLKRGFALLILYGGIRALL